MNNRASNFGSHKQTCNRGLLMLIQYSHISSTYEQLAATLRKRCGKKTRIPNLIHPTKRQYTIQGLSFVFFGMHLGHVVHKCDLIAFLRRHGVHTTDPQPRHLGMQFGLDFMVMRSYHPGIKRCLRAGEYCLKTLTHHHPSSNTEHRSYRMSHSLFEQVKKRHHNRCVCCGSPEGDANYKNPKILTTLERGHRDPRKPLLLSNCIPICTVCNHVYKNKVIFTARGFVKPLMKTRSR